MNVSPALIRMLANNNDQNAEKAFVTWIRFRDTHDVNISWADDGIGYLIAISPKPLTPDEIESRFFVAA